MPTYTPQEYARELKRLARQVPFAASKAINDTAKEAQRFQTAHLRREYIERNRLFLSRAVKIKPFATKARLQATIQIDPPGGQRTADILEKFERGGTKRSRGGGHIAIPVEARRTKRGIVSKAQRPKALQFRTENGRIVGIKRTFLIPGVGIFQRTGKRKVKLLFALEKSVRIPSGLDFGRNVERIVDHRFARNWRKALTEALRTAR